MMPEVIRKIHYMLLSSKEGVEKNQMASVYWKILDALQKKKDEFGENWPFFLQANIKGKNMSRNIRS